MKLRNKSNMTSLRTFVICQPLLFTYLQVAFYQKYIRLILCLALGARHGAMQGLSLISNRRLHFSSKFVRGTVSEIGIPAGYIIWRWTVRVWRIVVEVRCVYYVLYLWYYGWN